MKSFGDELKEERANLHLSKLVVIGELCNEISPHELGLLCMVTTPLTNLDFLQIVACQFSS